jgi:DNA modification methylase
MQLIHGDCLEKMKDIPDKSVDMILVDPPYIGMVNQQWDRMSDSEATNFFLSMKEQCFRILRYGGRFICFSSNDTLKFLYGGKLLHRELLVVVKDAKQVSAGRNTRRYKQHINCTEYIFVATKYAREYTQNLLLGIKGRLKSKEINERLGVATNGGGMWSIYSGDNVCGQVPTETQWDKFRGAFPSLPEFNSFGEVFNNSLGMGNVLTNFNFRIPNRKHPTQKPTELLEYLIRIYTNEGEMVLDNCMGSGSTGIACINTKRNFIGIEKDDKYFEIAEKRIEEHLTTAST